MAGYKDQIEPMTLGNMRANGVRSLDVSFVRVGRGVWEISHCELKRPVGACPTSPSSLLSSHFLTLEPPDPSLFFLLGVGFPTRRSNLKATYASEFSDGRCGSNMPPKCRNRLSWEKPIDPDLRFGLPSNAWSRLKPYPRNTLPESSPVQVP
jgi:hypothetical protein